MLTLYQRFALNFVRTCPHSVHIRHICALVLDEGGRVEGRMGGQREEREVARHDKRVNDPNSGRAFGGDVQSRQELRAQELKVQSVENRAGG